MIKNIESVRKVFGYSDEDEVILDDYEMFDPGEEREYQTELKDAIVEYVDDAISGTIVVATGGGKTRIANDSINELLDEDEDARILWITKDWRLLSQASNDFSSRYDYPVSRIGGGNEAISGLPDDRFEDSETDDNWNGRIVYTTIHTFSRDHSFFKKNVQFFSAIFIDEVHWGVTGDMYKDLRKIFKKTEIPIIGLTATPSEVNDDIIGEPITFRYLIKEGFLAKPKFHHDDDTVTEWDFVLKNNIITPDSYNELAQDEERNEFIVEKFLSTDEWGKTLLFAINVYHAEALLEEFSINGIDAESIHSQKTSEENERILQEFRDGDISVLINVQMATTGIDIPDIDSIFICRPTNSRTLYTQMVGRGSRITDEKDTFNLVEFTTNSSKYGDVLISGETFFDISNGSGSRDQNSPVVTRFKGAQVKYTPANTDKFKRVQLGASSYSVNRNQSFGIELELTTTSSDVLDDYLLDEDMWTEKAKEIEEIVDLYLVDESDYYCMAEEYQEHNPDLDYKNFSVVYDGSCGWEIVSPVLDPDSGGLEALYSFLTEDEEGVTLQSRLKEIGIGVNYSTGFHLHLGYKLPEGSKLENLLSNLIFLEPYISQLLPKSRVMDYDPEDNSYNHNSPNSYCLPLHPFLTSEVIDEIYDYSDLADCFDSAIDYQPKYFGYNFSNLIEEGDIKTFEVRFHSGTLNEKKVLSWVSLWMILLERAKHLKVYEEFEDIPKLRGETFAPMKHHASSFNTIMTKFIPPSHTELHGYIAQRVADLKGQWK
ncbi:MAG: DEAD/DEAH box helicase family protein [Bacteriovoracaceae bacterium]|nr:DEAD/DEAH box helicase family protein [Bacteriovoracaceae bacterium]